MELNSVGGVFFVFDAHDFVLIRVGGGFEDIGEGVFFYQKGMIAGGFEGVVQVFEQVFPIVVDQGRFAVHEAVRRV